MTGWQQGRSKIKQLLANGDLDRVKPSGDLSHRLLDKTAAHIATAQFAIDEDPTGALQLDVLDDRTVVDTDQPFHTLAERTPPPGPFDSSLRTAGTVGPRRRCAMQARSTPPTDRSQEAQESGLFETPIPGHT